MIMLCDINLFENVYLTLCLFEIILLELINIIVLFFF